MADVLQWSAAAKSFRLGVYRHFKYGQPGHDTDYRVLMLARDSEDRAKELVVYQSLQNPDRTWVRPLEMFIEEVDRPDLNYRGPRFTWLSKT